MTGRRAASRVALVAMLVVGCASDPAPVASPAVTLLPPPAPTSVVPAATAIPDTQTSPSPNVEPLPSGLDPEIVGAILWRREAGLRSDPAWVMAVAADPDAVHDFSYPVTPDEEAFIWERNADLMHWSGFVRGYANTHRDVYGGLYLDNPNGRVMTLWTADPEAHLAAILAKAGPDAPIAARLVRWTERELEAVQDRVGWDWPLWERVDASLEGVGADVSENAVHIEVSSANPDAPAEIVAELAERLDVPAEMFVVESDGTGILRMPTGRVKGVVIVPEGLRVPRDVLLQVDGRSDAPGVCFTEPFGGGIDDAGRFDLTCTVGTWIIQVETYDGDRDQTLVWGVSRPVVIADGEVTRIRIRLDPGGPTEQ